MELTQNWMLMAALTPTLWAMGCVLDSCLVGGKVYRHPADGAIVSCLFCLAPVALVFTQSTESIQGMINPGSAPTAAVAAGLAYAAHLFFYFRTLHSLNDVSGAETFMSLSVLFVPLLAWWLLGERLPAHFYLAFILASFGVLLQCLPVIRRVGLPLLINLTLSTMAVSLSMVWQSSALQSHGFNHSTLTFNLTGFLVAIVCIACNRRLRRRLWRLSRQLPAILVAGELLGALAILSSHRATQHGPSVSVIALIECLLPLIIIAISSALVCVDRHWPLLSCHQQLTLSLQLQGMRAKFCATAMLMSSLLILAA